jgi:hypothetical protein
LTNLPAYLQPIAAGDHNVQYEQRRTLGHSLRKHGDRRGEYTHGKTGSLQAMTHKTRYVSIVFHYEDNSLHADIVL